MIRLLLIAACLAAMWWIFSTTRAGKKLARRTGLPAPRKDRAPQADRDYLLMVCGGDKAAVKRLIDQARAGDDEMTEAQAYRRAIRAHLRDKV